MHSDAAATPRGPSPAGTERDRPGIETALDRNREFADAGHHDGAQGPSPIRAECGRLREPQRSHGDTPFLPHSLNASPRRPSGDPTRPVPP